MGIDAGPGQLQKMKAAPFADVIKVHTDTHTKMQFVSLTLTHIHTQKHPISLSFSYALTLTENCWPKSQQQVKPFFFPLVWIDGKSMVTDALTGFLYGKNHKVSTHTLSLSHPLSPSTHSHAHSLQGASHFGEQRGRRESLLPSRRQGELSLSSLTLIC